MREVVFAAAVGPFGLNPVVPCTPTEQALLPPVWYSQQAESRSEADRSAVTWAQTENALMDDGLKYWSEVIRNLAWDPAAAGVLLFEKPVEKVQPGESVQDLIPAMKDCPFLYLQRIAVKNRFLLIWVTAKQVTKLMARVMALNQRRNHLKAAVSVAVS